MGTVLVTGAGGFVGKYTAAALASLGLEPLAFRGDMFSTDFYAYMRKYRPEYLINLAWVTGEGYLDSYENALFVQKGLEMYGAFYENGGKRAVFIGTEQEYKRTGEIFREDSTPAPESLYAVCKSSLGSVLLKDAEVRGRGFVWGRIFFVYGAGEKPKRLMPSLISGLAAGESVTCSYDGFFRDYIYVKDLAGAICHCLLSDYSGAVNLSGGRDTTIGEIAGIIRGKIGKGDVKFKTVEESGNQPLYIRGDISLLESLGWKHRYSLEAGLAEEIYALTGIRS